MLEAINGLLADKATFTAIRNELLELVLNKQWKRLEDIAVSFDTEGKPLSYFADNTWDFASYRVGTELTTLGFSFRGEQLSLNLERELKSIVLAYIYHSRHALRINSVAGKLNSLKRLAKVLESNEVRSFEGLTIDDLKHLSKSEQLTLQEIDLAPINALNDLADFLPFQINFFEKITLSKLRVKQLAKEQHPVIPIRIYMEILNSFSKEIVYWHTYREELETAVQITLNYEQTQAAVLKKKLRHGHLTTWQVFNNSDTKYHQFIKALETKGIPLIDYEGHHEWSMLWEEIRPSLRSYFYDPFQLIQIGKQMFKSHVEVKDFCRLLDTKCRYLILCLSGMRSNELLQITPDYGAQTVTLDGLEIHLFHTKQQKITQGYQGQNDVYVTTKTGHLAYELINFINRPVREWMQKKGEQEWFLNAFSHFHYPRSVSRSKNVLNSILRLFNQHSADLAIELTGSDIEMLRRSDPEKSFNVGERWHLTPHQLRRSLAYYLVGMELADFPQLKQQFSHYSIAMTMYYARNASSFQKMHNDLEKERVRQQSNTYARLVDKANSGVYLGGNKGKNLFSESYTSRDVSEAFYKKEIQAGRKHIHAVAPGMYCINHNCSMRVGIDLSECDSCDWAIIESSAYAQAARMESIKILEAMECSQELSPDIVAFHITRIRAAEKIIAGFDSDFKPYSVSKYANSYLLASTA